ncbi:alpha/beta fold hydrolase [Stratiformator vulcanicus]|nr:alpha/beta fold hydrolase [Stratiformator vulcanicus]
MIEVDRHQITYFRDGRTDGPTLVLSHSLGACSQMWRPQVAKFEAAFNVVRFDFPGHGDSSAAAEGITIEDLGRLTLAVCDRLGIDRFHFGGLSLGGMVGLWLGRYAAERIDRLVLSNTAARIADTRLLVERLQTIERDGLSSIEQSVMAGWLTSDFQSAHHEATAEISSMFCRTTAAGYVNIARAVCCFDFERELRSIKVPTLVLGGEHDRATPPEWNSHIAERVGNGRYHSLNAAHLSNVEAAEAWNDAVAEFLNAPVV